MRTTKQTQSGPKAKLEVEIEKKIIEDLQAMEDYTKISKAELVTTALKRFIITHKDFLPDTPRL